jgi:hypothetical protein
MLNSKIFNVFLFEKAILELSALSGVSVQACADIANNTAKDTDYTPLEVIAQLKAEALKGKKSRGKHKRRGKGTR